MIVNNGTIERVSYYKQQLHDAFVILEITDSYGKIYKIKGNTRKHPEKGDSISCIVGDYDKKYEIYKTDGPITTNLPIINTHIESRLKFLVQAADLKRFRFNEFYKILLDVSGDNIWKKLMSKKSEGIPDKFVESFNIICNTLERYLSDRNSQTSDKDWFRKAIYDYFITFDVKWRGFDNIIDNITKHILVFSNCISQNELIEGKKFDDILKIANEKINTINPIDIIEENKHKLIGAISSSQYQEYITKLVEIGKASDDDCCIAAIMVELHNAQKDGHSCIKLSDYEELPYPDNKELFNQHFVKYNDCLYMQEVYYEESTLAMNISKMMKNVDNYDTETIMELIDDNTLVPTNKQIEAIVNSVNNKVSIVLGGAGTGKTTVCKLIVKALNNLGKSNILFLAPTGKAVNRLKKCISGYESSHFHTVHKYISDMHYFKTNECKCIDFKGKYAPEIKECTHCTKIKGTIINPSVLVIDETTMLDLSTANKLFEIINSNIHVIFLGDPHQLPSISYGCVLEELSKIVSSITLDVVHRQAKEILLSKQIDRVKNKRVLLPGTDDSYNCLKLDNTKIDEYVKQWQKNYDSTNSVVITFQNKYRQRLNTILQDIINPTKEIKKPITGEIIYPYTSTKEGITTHHEYRIGDKVMQLSNNYDKQIFNGSVGIITQIYQTMEDRLIESKGVKNSYSIEIPTIVVDFGEDGKKIYYDNEIRNQLDLAYAITIHKSQGSEYDNVLFVCYGDDTGPMNCKMAYTAISRAKKICTLLTTETRVLDSFRKSAVIRQSNLSIMLNEELETI